ncbi:Queuine tRNA-ribosyltransferase subunit qtrtd1 [Lunasporangiospora selenospora]|uniref:Queuine tRNA-ribosyltransferase accessory subunit 2 n=1 Tax=Lunasporangiospora selenospora TaxID=979761 RepID=A0A9P6FYN9_9FUNG|nr:Queuine tRNA-ribosyltransferase subunit qtrtd1 [Lunasporangiospora selenospora]
MSPLTFNIIRQTTQRSAARRGTLVMSNSGTMNSSSTETNDDSTSASKRAIETPGCFMYSVKGSVPHLTPDTLRLQDFGGVHISMEHLLQDHQPNGFEKWPSQLTISKYLNLQDMIVLCDIRDPSKFVKAPLNSDRFVSMMTHQGVRQLTMEEYLKVVRVYQPDIITTFADNVSDPLEPGQKRIRKSIERSLKWLDLVLAERQGYDAVSHDRALEEAKKKEKKEKKEKRKAESQGNDSDNEQDSAVTTSNIATNDYPAPALGAPEARNAAQTAKPWTNVSVFAHVIGSQIEQERIRSAVETSKRSEVDGFVIDTNIIGGSKDEVFGHLKTSINHLPAEKPRLVYGMQAPEDILRSIAVGADLFDTSYPFQLTEDGKASLYSFGSSATLSPFETQLYHSTSGTNRWINLWDDEHVDKFVPLLEGCECYACKDGRHSRAYIGHLLRTHEMLATVLLMSHNMHQYSKFFACVRESIQDGSFDRHAKEFHDQFGVEPKPTGQLHAAQAAVEASISRRNRLDDEPGKEGSSTTRADSKDASTEGNRKKKPRGSFVNKKELKLEKQKLRQQQAAQKEDQEPTQNA